MRERLVLLFLSLVLILAGCATGGDAEMQVAGEQSKASADTGGTSDQPLSVDPAVTRGVLENGLTYYIRQNSEPEDRAFLRLAVNAGSVLEDDDQLGLAHFLEHMAFNGTESYSGNEIISFLERLGMQFGPDINAYTSFDETVYQLDVPTDDEETFSTALNVLYEWAALMTLDPEEIDKERGVIVEEWRFRRGAQARMSEEQYPVLFGDSRYASRLPIGDMNIVRDFDPAVLRRYYEDWYRPELMSVIAVGDFDVAEVEAEISAVFSQIEPATDARERPVYEVPSHDETRFVVASDPETSYTTVSVIVKRDSQPLVSKDDYRELLQGQLFSAMFNTRLADISREPDAPFLDAGVSVGRLVRTEAAATIGAAVEGNNVTPAVGALLIETRRIIEHGFTETELDRAKRNALRGIEQAYRERNDISSRAFADEYVRAYLENEAIPGIPAERELYDELLPTIDLEDVNSLAETYLDDQNRVVMVSAIESEDLPEITESELEEAFRAAQLVEVAPYVDVEVAGEILQTVPVAGSIMESRPLEIDGAVEWRLSNGARIVLYPTD
ncbi:MAG: M16 family metallopeptidase, partial [Spirochaetales bacterium]